MVETTRYWIRNSLFQFGAAGDVQLLIRCFYHKKLERLLQKPYKKHLKLMLPYIKFKKKVPWLFDSETLLGLVEKVYASAVIIQKKILLSVIENDERLCQVT